MSDIIQLLPDSIANQIAAGEVIQRPASVVKELIENAVDAGATSIDVIIKDAGRTLIQVIDNGSGMSETDARLCFERHATSKIKKVEDIFNIQTKGFRGEALASIAAVAQVELNTRTADMELGTSVIIEGSKCTQQEACNCAVGTSFIVKNLFFNVPARRNFLKTERAELGHIQDEFIRVALVHANVAFTLNHNGKVIYNLPKSTLKQRIVNTFGSVYNSRIFPLDTQCDVVNVVGFIGKPEFARKTRGEQYLFVNERFIKHPYFNHAVVSAFESVIPQEHFPTYFIYLQVNPQSIDINIHPTKTEVKFQDERLIYSILHSAVKKSIGNFHLNSQIDFENVSPIEFSTANIHSQPKIPQTVSNPNYNPFANSGGSSGRQNEWKPTVVADGWQKIYESIKENIPEVPTQENIEQIDNQQLVEDTSQISDNVNDISLFQTQNKYIIAKTKSGFVVIEQEAALERILFERNIKYIENQPCTSQKLLFPETLVFTVQDAEIINELLSEFTRLGFEIEPFGNNTFILNAVPPELGDKNVQEIIEQSLEAYKNNLLSLKISKKNNLAHSFSRSLCHQKKNQILTTEEMQSLVNELFSSQSPQISPSGRKICLLFNENELMRLFR
ncbi:MAG: DNA mismatch repair endonuclease MutL [Bacteroidales bacterium]|jgi:DNA mismatch repair protein MutL|nr:DNA mismatch repair endonuclease MutL [Bacteroidales bacterium]